MKILLGLIFALARLIARPLMAIGYKYRVGIDPMIVVALYLIPQKIGRINGMTPWPVDFRSKVTYPQRIKLGKFTFPGVSPGCYIQGKNGIEFGDNVRLGPNVGIVSANHDIADFEKHIECEPIRIGNNVWIGMAAMIMPSVQIGDNVVIAAGSIVTKNIPSNSIVMGSPARVVKEKPPYTGQLAAKNYGTADLT